MNFLPAVPKDCFGTKNVELIFWKVSVILFKQIMQDFSTLMGWENIDTFFRNVDRYANSIVNLPMNHSKENLQFLLSFKTYLQKMLSPEEKTGKLSVPISGTLLLLNCDQNSLSLRVLFHAHTVECFCSMLTMVQEKSSAEITNIPSMTLLISCCLQKISFFVMNHIFLLFFL